MENKLLTCPFCISYKSEIDQYDISDQNVFILQTNPDINYYDNMPNKLATPYEHHLFVLTKPVACFEVVFYKSLAKAQNHFSKKLNVYLGQAKFDGKIYNIIRFRENELKEVLYFLDIMKNYQLEFVRLRKFTRTTAQINYKKYINLIEIRNRENIFKDQNSKSVYLIRLPQEINFDEFEILSKRMKNNGNFSLFEPYLAFSLKENFMCHCFFMFYSPHFKSERLTDFKNLLYREIERLKMKV